MGNTDWAMVARQRREGWSEQSRAQRDLEVAVSDVAFRRAQIARQRTEIETWRAAVVLYGDHQYNCSWSRDKSVGPCNCGFDKLLEEATQ